MTHTGSTYTAIEARSAFQSALRRARWYEVRQELRGRPSGLLPFGVIASALHLYNRQPQGILQVPLAAIVGSVDRAGDLTRNLLPRRDYLRDRWSRVYVHMTTHGFDPVSLYKVGDIYFINDGNHRVSILKSLNAYAVEAQVDEFPCRVPLGPEFRVRDLPQKVAYAEFLEQTNLDVNRPGLDEILLMDPVSYRKLEEHIAGHAYWLEYSTGRSITVYRATASWFDLVYVPTVQMIRELKLLKDFPGRTEADLYVTLTQHHRQLVRGTERPVPLNIAAEHLRRAYSRPYIRRLWYKVTRKNPLHTEALPVMATAPAGGRAYNTLPTRPGFDAQKDDQ